MNYSSTYKGSGRSGMIYTTSSARMMSIGGGGSMAQAPTASMGSTSSSRGIGMTTSTITTAPQISGIYTSASTVKGGVTTAETYGSQRAPGRRKSAEGGPGVPEGSCDECHWVWHPELGYYVCEICGSNSLDGCDHLYEDGYCWCPLDFNWAAGLFMALLASAYAIYKARARKKVC